MLWEHGRVRQGLLWLRIIKMENKVAIITGGAGGIGSSVCSNFVDEGTKVVIADVDYDRSKALADELGDYAIGVEVDVKNESSVESIVECAVKTFGRVDYAVHSSGNNIKSPILDMEIDKWREALDTHLTGAFLLCKYAGRQMVKQGEGGSVVFISSVAAWAPVPERGAYGPAKAGLNNFAGLLSLEWAEYDINVNTVCPGMALTPMTKMVYKRDPSLRTQRLKRMPAGREVLPQEIADLVMFLCSDKANHINGVSIPVDGGFVNSGFLPEEMVKLRIDEIDL
jgi:NAD(P)-dependent dehydrogenase (short-subunit alcohol dehydrogenase family)